MNIFTIEWLSAGREGKGDLAEKRKHARPRSPSRSLPVLLKILIEVRLFFFAHTGQRNDATQSVSPFLPSFFFSGKDLSPLILSPLLSSPLLAWVLFVWMSQSGRTHSSDPIQLIVGNPLLKALARWSL
mmetsp:Transcript_41907/g.82760  ORF Transcript_41907/g.82760 Transcript_41907/m.82760 type:complete len:129 (+) Transcript_41907:2106-2492(+)